MKDLLRLFTPPEWSVWNAAGKLAYVAVFVAIMVPVIWFAGLLGDLVERLLRAL